MEGAPSGMPSGERVGGDRGAEDRGSRVLQRHVARGWQRRVGERHREGVQTEACTSARRNDHPASERKTPAIFLRG